MCLRAPVLHESGIRPDYVEIPLLQGVVPRTAGLDAPVSFEALCFTIGILDANGCLEHEPIRVQIALRNSAHRIRSLSGVVSPTLRASGSDFGISMPPSSGLGSYACRKVHGGRANADADIIFGFEANSLVLRSGTPRRFGHPDSPSTGGETLPPPVRLTHFQSN